MASPKVSVVATAALIAGEGPHWDARTSSLLYVDALGKEIHRLAIGDTPASDNVLHLDRDATFIIPVKGEPDKFVIGQGHDFVLLTWDGKSSRPGGLQVLATVETEDDQKENKMNDAKADAQGRLWTGTLGQFRSLTDFDVHKGALYSLTGGRQVKRHLEGVSVSNGLDWSPDGKTFYYIDSVEHRVDGFDFDPKEGEISNRRVVFDFEANDVKGLPDGMTVDANGNLWVACFGGSQVIRVDPATGRVLSTLPLPTPNVTSVAWGGERLDELFVTTATFTLTEEQRAASPAAGTTFRVTGLDASGLPARDLVL